MLGGAGRTTSIFWEWYTGFSLKLLCVHVDWSRVRSDERSHILVRVSQWNLFWEPVHKRLWFGWFYWKNYSRTQTLSIWSHISSLIYNYTNQATTATTTTNRKVYFYYHYQYTDDAEVHEKRHKTKEKEVYKVYFFISNQPKPSLLATWPKILGVREKPFSEVAITTMSMLKSWANPGKNNIFLRGGPIEACRP